MFTRACSRLLPFSLALAFAFASATAGAEVRRALLIGIDKYAPDEKAAPGQAPETASRPNPSKGRGAWYDLDGAVNDVEAMGEILVARYGFRREDVRLITNRDATRERILAAIREHLVEKSDEGDVAFLYYAGHGSQVVNSKEPDGLDETIVPSDSYLGAYDIRDKEIKRLLNDAIDRGAIVTAIFDSCHSGNVARGMAKTRKLPLDTRDYSERFADEKDDPRPAPGTRGALVLSAAQSNQLANEARDELDNPRGLFSLALVRVLQTAAIEESAERLMLRVEAALRAEGKAQVPVIDTTAERGAKSLLGLEVGGSGRPAVAVKEVDPDGTIAIRGGLALGLGEGSELVRAGAPAVRIRVASVQGMDESRARVIEGELSQVKTGDLFELDLWAPPEGTQLRVWVSDDRLPEEQLQQVAAELGKLRDSEALTWVDDPTQVGADRALHIVTRERGSWRLLFPDDRNVDLGRSPTAAAVVEQLGAEGDRPSVFVELPPAQDLVASLRFLSDQQSAIRTASDPASAHYWLLGRAAEGGIEYAWVLREATWGDPGERIPFPKHTTWVRFEPGWKLSEPDERASRGVRTLESEVHQLARVRAWLVLASPPPAADGGKFPYDLVLTAGEREVAGPDDEVRNREILELRLRADPADLEGRLEKRYVYVFVLDREGRSNLLFPGEQAGVGENQLPAVGKSEKWPVEISLDTPVRVQEPFGLDTYLLLTTKDPIPNPIGTFSWGPVVTRTRGRGPSSPLGRLIESAKMGTRGAASQPIATPATWSIKRIQVLSTP